MKWRGLWLGRKDRAVYLSGLFLATLATLQDKKSAKHLCSPAQHNANLASHWSVLPIPLREGFIQPFLTAKKLR